MSDIYTLLKEYEVVRRERVIARSVRPGDEFKPFASRVRALKEYGWTLRDSIDFFYKNYLSSVPEGQRIDNNTLSKKLSAWKSQGLFTDKDVERELFLLQNKLGKCVNPLTVGSVEEVATVSIVSNVEIVEEPKSHNVITFLKEYEKQCGAFDDVKKKELVEVYNNNKDKDLSDIVFIANQFA